MVGHASVAAAIFGSAVLLLTTLTGAEPLRIEGFAGASGKVNRKIQLKEGDREPYSVIVNEGRAVVNWFVTAGSADLNRDFKVNPPSGTNVVVRPSSSPLNIFFDIADDEIPEKREFFKFHVEVDYFDEDGDRSDFINDDYTIEVVDNDKACTLDLNGDGRADRADLTFDELYERMSEANRQLKYTRERLTLAKQQLILQEDIFEAAKQLFVLHMAEGVLSAVSLGLSQYGRMIGEELPKFIQGLVIVKDEAYGVAVEKDIASMVKVAAALLENAVRFAPVLGLAATAYKLDQDLTKALTDEFDFKQRIVESEALIRELESKAKDLEREIDALLDCLGPNGVAGKPGAEQPSIVVDTSGNETYYYDAELRIVRGTAGGDDITLQAPTFGGWPIEIVTTGDGPDTMRFSPTLEDLPPALKVFSGGDGRDTLLLDKDRSRFAILATGAEIAITPYTKVTECVVIDPDTCAPRERPSEGPQILAHDVELVRFSDGAIVRLGSDSADVLEGSAGSDVLSGRGGRDRIVGGDGDDQLQGGPDFDIMTGGRGNDFYSVDRPGEARERLDEGVDAVSSSAAYVLGENIENLALEGEKDISGTGNVLANRIFGNRGANRLSGRGGADLIYAGADNAKDVFLYDRRSDSSLAAMDNLFQFDRRDSPDEKIWDRIDLSRIDADDEMPGDQKFRFVTDFRKVGASTPEGQVRVLPAAPDDAIVLIDIDGDNAADMAIYVVGSGTLREIDFAL